MGISWTQETGIAGEVLGRRFSSVPTGARASSGGDGEFLCILRASNRRLHEQTEYFKDRYRWRAGIEATMSQLKRQMQLAKLRIRGMAAVTHAVFLRALGLMT